MMWLIDLLIRMLSRIIKITPVLITDRNGKYGLVIFNFMLVHFWGNKNKYVKVNTIYTFYFP